MASIINVDQINESTNGSGVMIPGHVVQYVSRNFTMNQGTFTAAANTAMTGVYVDITPKSASNKLVWYTQIIGTNNNNTGYGKFNVYNHTTTTQWSTGYNASFGYSTGSNSANQWIEVPILAVNTAGTTSTMRLMLYVYTNGGTSNFGWSNNSTRTVQVMEIAQ